MADLGGADVRITAQVHQSFLAGPYLLLVKAEPEEGVVIRAEAWFAKDGSLSRVWREPHQMPADLVAVTAAIGEAAARAAARTGPLDLGHPAARERRDWLILVAHEIEAGGAP
jgi:hypothetical protein